MYRGYKGHRTTFRYAYDCTIKYDKDKAWKTGQFRAVQQFFYELEEWCEEHTTGPWSRQGDRFFFEHKDNLILFKLTFMGMI